MSEASERNTQIKVRSFIFPITREIFDMILYFPSNHRPQTAARDKLSLDARKNRIKLRPHNWKLAGEGDRNDGWAW